MPYRWPNKALFRRGLLLLLLTAIFLVACGQETPQTTLDPQTESARTIFNLSI